MNKDYSEIAIKLESIKILANKAAISCSIEQNPDILNELVSIHQLLGDILKQEQLIQLNS